MRLGKNMQFFIDLQLRLHKAGTLLIPSLANRIGPVQGRYLRIAGTIFPVYFILGRKTYRLNFSLNVPLKGVLANLEVLLYRNSYPKKGFPKVYEKAQKDLGMNPRSSSQPTKLLKMISSSNAFSESCSRHKMYSGLFQ